MEIKTLVIKEESIDRFFKEHGTMTSEMRRSSSIYNTMQDEVVVKKPDGLNIGDRIEFHIGNRSPDGRFSIDYMYLYSVSYYDDISYKLVLEDFKVNGI